ncbi:putative septum site-determining protein MinC [Candidatus Methylobacter favarea]|uniref:Probable septum site-determining protein MinC n=1 Tax=Candidatus Methylobacter favarea TaxID=2707345 RepID=A0A8S0Y9K0_9GAMM|nr:septum site-determining protein MinC [Candidatus Methylobacter favarea]CAA9890288.1 putative septum site-determining protein MinC [Candidatus Methylobacter favarea]
MSVDSQKTPYNPLALEFKSSTFSVPVLILFSNDLAVIEQQLQAKISLAPEFFRNSPLVLDVQELNKKDLDLDIAALMEILREPGLLPVGIRGGNLKQNKKALALQIPVYSVTSSSATAEAQKRKTITPPVPEPITDPGTTILITHPVRSGQRLYASGDLVILAQVSAGAEILAEGNIHVYGTLRGRAMAGVQGNKAARIFCSDLQAELISIAGDYKISEDMQAISRNKPVQVYLQDHTIIIKDI